MPGQLIRGIAHTAVVAGTATAVSNRVSRRQAGRWAAEDQAHPQPAYRPVPAGTYYGRYQWPMFQQHAARHVQQQAVAASPPPPPPPPPPVAAPDALTARLAELQRLGELKAQGALSETEFQAQKARLLGG